MSSQRNRRLLFGIFGLAIVVLSGCGMHDSSTGNVISPPMVEMPGTGMQNENPLRLPIEGSVSFSADIQPIFDNRCTSCHRPPVLSGSLDLTEGTSYDSLVNQPTSAACMVQVPDSIRVVPSDPEGSMLWRKTKPTCDRCGNPMPRFTEGLGIIAPDEFALIEMWIVQGALNN